MIPPWPTYARERLFRDNCFSYTRELRLLMNIFYIKRNTVDTSRTSIMHLNWPWIGVLYNLTIGTESDEVVDAEHPPRMPMTTARTVPTKASIVPRAVFDLGRGVDVLKGTFFVETSAELLVEIALGHLGHVVFVEKLAVVALFAKTAQPMLANHRTVTSGRIGIGGIRVAE